MLDHFNFAFATPAGFFYNIRPVDRRYIDSVVVGKLSRRNGSGTSSGAAFGAVAAMLGAPNQGCNLAAI